VSYQLWEAEASVPTSGASMNAACTFGPDLVSGKSTDHWVCIAGPLTGPLIAVGLVFVLRGAGGGKAGSGAEQGGLFIEVQQSDQP
jgi:aquaporin Z